ncbi:DNA repair protein REV1-like [Cucumis melo]|uniref:DNA repair protein REV1-like n=1 Tax=Cucumis melo TaxID=3656 RepID=A0A1S3B6P8_CUCME|nr:DNA repair protein REV1-like [Cucumis melo]
MLSIRLTSSFVRRLCTTLASVYQELRGYMLKYGGRFVNYFSRRSVSHIICSNLPDSKIKNPRSFSRGLPVVKPTWILDSVASNKLLSWVPYQLSRDEMIIKYWPSLVAVHSYFCGYLLVALCDFLFWSKA